MLTPDQINSYRQQFNITPTAATSPAPSYNGMDTNSRMSMMFGTSAPPDTSPTPDTSSGSTPGIMDTIGNNTADQYQSAGQKIYSTVQKGASDLQAADQAPTAAGRIGGSLKAIGETALGTASGAVQGLFAPVSGVLQAAADKTGMHPLAALTQTPEGQKLAAWAQQHPEAATNLSDLFNVGTAAIGGEGAPSATIGDAASSLKGAATDASQSVKGAVKSVIPAGTAPDQAIVSSYTKAIKPTIAGKNTLGATQAYNGKVLNAVQTIAENKPNLKFTTEDGALETNRTPQSVAELAQAVDQTKKSIYSQYDALTKQAGEAGAKVEPTAVTKDLQTVVNNKALQLSHPEAVSYAQKLIDRYSKAGPMDASTAQQVIENYNAELQSFYRNPSYNQASHVAIDAAIVKNLRSSLDDAITNSTGTQYQALKNQYGALKTIEGDVNKSANRIARLNNKGLADYTDIFSGGDIVAGLLTLDPTLFIRGAAQRGIKSWFKSLNSPDKAIGNMFKSADQLENQASNSSKATLPTTTPTATPAATTKNSIPDTVAPASKSASNGQRGMIKNPFSKADTSKSVTPQSVATNLNGRDIPLVQNYVNNPSLDNLMRLHPVLRGMGADNLDPAMLQRFLKEAIQHRNESTGGLIEGKPNGARGPYKKK